MKKVFLLTAMMIISLLITALYGQNACKVLLPRIGDSYTGSCKKGLADGKGEASGVDKYTGEFKKGLPDGEGTYVWQTGEVYKGKWRKGMRNGNGELIIKLADRDSVLAGIWKDDSYIGEKAISPYVIGYRSNVGRVTCMKMGDERIYVKYKFSRAGETATYMTITDLLLQGSSGTENITNNFMGFENVQFPFEGKIKFNAPNALNTATLNCEVRLTINEPGPWLVTIYY